MLALKPQSNKTHTVTRHRSVALSSCRVFRKRIPPELLHSYKTNRARIILCYIGLRGVMCFRRDMFAEGYCVRYDIRRVTSRAVYNIILCTWHTNRRQYIINGLTSKPPRRPGAVKRRKKKFVICNLHSNDDVRLRRPPGSP